MPCYLVQVEIYSIAVDKRQKELEKYVIRTNPSLLFSHWHVLYCTVLYCCRISLKVEDSDEDADVQDNSSPMAKGKAAAAVDSKVLDEWKRANGNNNNNNNKNSKASNNGAQKGPVKVSLANGKDAKSCEW